MMAMCVVEHREDSLGVWNRQQKNVEDITVVLSLLCREMWGRQDPPACQALW